MTKPSTETPPDHPNSGPPPPHPSVSGSAVGVLWRFIPWRCRGFWWGFGSLSVCHPDGLAFEREAEPAGFLWVV